MRLRNEGTTNFILNPPPPPSSLKKKDKNLPFGKGFYKYIHFIV